MQGKNVKFPGLHGAKLHNRAYHVFSEAAHVFQLEQACIDGRSIEDLGALLNASHKSCSTEYECSSVKLDALVDSCL